MTYPQDSQQYESFVPVYDAIPEKWEDARPFVVEQLKKISDAVNIREIAWFLNEQLLTGKSFIPGTATAQNRQVFRMTINCGALVIGLNTFPHGITFNIQFTLVQMWAAATNTSLFTAEPIPNGSDTLSMDATNIYITVAAAWQRSICVIEYMLEI